MFHALMTFYARCFYLVLLCALSVLSCFVQPQSSPVRSGTMQPALVNLDFEQGIVGQVPEGWFAPPAITSHTAEISEENPKSGKRAALLRSVPDAKSNGSGFGNLTQSTDGTPYRGHRVRFRAAVRLEGAEPTTNAKLWLCGDRNGKQTDFFKDCLGEHPITSGEWQYYEIVRDIENDAATLNIGMMMFGKGKAWIDDVSVEDLGKVVVLAEPARPLTKTGLVNLTAYARLLGYVRHFHPSDEAGAADWNAVAVEGVRYVEDARDATELAQRLQTFFSPLAPTLRVFPTGGKTPAINPLPQASEPALKIVSYRHVGFGQKTTSHYTPYKTERASADAPAGKVPENFPDPQKPFMADLGGGVSCLLPLALYADASGTLPRAASSPKSSAAAAPLVRYSGNDRATRIADVALAWNIFQHFYPYFDVVKTDWPLALKDSLMAAALVADEKAFLDTLRRMVAALHDGHGMVSHASDALAHATPFLFGWVENKLVITQIGPQGANGLQPGDVVLRIDGKNVARTLADTEALISSATPQWQRYTALQKLRLGAIDSEVKLDVQPRTGSPRTVVVRRDAASLSLHETRPEKVSEIKPGIFYLDLDRIKNEDFKAVLPKLEKATGIIFDLRGYPSSVTDDVIFPHLTDKPIESVRWLVPIITQPDQKGPITYDEKSRWYLEPVAPRLKAKIAFITDGRAISYAESFMGIIEAYKLASIVGETTAGTNGNTNPFTLPGGYDFLWTGMKVLKHDGSQHHGVGIRPTVPVSRTIRGIAEGKDEQLEKAIAVVSKGAGD